MQIACFLMPSLLFTVIENKFYRRYSEKTDDKIRTDDDSLKCKLNQSHSSKGLARRRLRLFLIRYLRSAYFAGVRHQAAAALSRFRNDGDETTNLEDD